MGCIRERNGAIVAEYIDHTRTKRSHSFPWQKLGITKAQAIKDAKAFNAARYQEKRLVEQGLVSPEQVVMKQAGDKSIESLLSAYESARRGEITDRSLSVAVDAARKAFKGAGITRLRTIEPGRILRWLDEYGQARQLSPRRYNQYILATRSIAAWAEERGMIPDNPLRKLRLKPDQGNVHKARSFTPAEVWTLIHHGGKYKHLFRFAIFTGLRWATLRQLHTDWIDGDAMNIPGAAMKNRRDAYLPIPMNCHDIPYAYLYEQRLIFDTVMVRNRFKTLIRKLGIEEVVDGRYALLTSMRHTFTTFCAAAGVSHEDRDRLRGDVGRNIGEAVYTDRRSLYPNLRKASDQMVEWFLDQCKSLSGRDLR